MSKSQSSKQSSKGSSVPPRHSSTNVDITSNTADTPRTATTNPSALFPRTQPAARSSLEEELVRDVPYDDYAGFAQFLRRNMSILDSFRQQWFEREIAALLYEGDEDLAEQYAEKLILLTECKKHNSDHDHLTAYLTKLNKKERRYLAHLDNAIGQVLAHCRKENASNRNTGVNTASSKSGRTVLERPTKSRHDDDASASVTHGMKAVSIHPKQTNRHDESYSKSAPAHYMHLARHDANLPTVPEPWRHETPARTQPQYPPVAGPWTQHDTRRDSAAGNRHDPYSQSTSHEYGTGSGKSRRHEDIPPTSFGRRERSYTTDSGQQQRGTSDADSDLSQTVAIKGNNIVRKTMENRTSIAGKLTQAGFRVYHGGDAKQFYIKFRVFAIYTYAENSSTAAAAPKLGKDEHLTYNTDLGVYIRSHKQRYIVVGEGVGYCTVVPINTYSGKGLFKPGLKEAHIRAHATAYTGRQPPPPLTNRRWDRDAGKWIIEREPETPKEAIEITPASSSPDCHLNEASRINFAQPTTIQHNVRAFKVGMVAKDSRPYFQTYWEQHRGKL